MPFISWILFLQLSAAASFPLLAYVLPRSPDRGYGVARVLGWLWVGLLSFSFGLAGIVPSNAMSVWGCLTLLVILGLVAARLGAGSLRGFSVSIRPLLREILVVELLFYATFGFFLLLRAYQPEIFWGEKPMDFTFLNYLIRLEKLPAQDPWAAGSTMHYYYLGSYLIAILHKASGLSSAYGYNLGLALLPAYLVVALYSALRNAVRKRNVAILGALIVVLISNPEVLYLAWVEKHPVNFDLFWASSRILHSAMANEYPLWTFLFGDLHSHSIALPFTGALLALGLSLFTNPRWKTVPQAVVFYLVYSASLGSLLMINGWDFMTYAGVSTLLFLLKRADKSVSRSVNLRFVQNPLVGLVLVLSFAWFGSLSFRNLLGANQNATVTLEKFGFNYGHELFRHLGHFLVPYLLITAYLLQRKIRRIKLSVSEWQNWITFSGAVSAIPLGLGAYAVSQDAVNVPLGVLIQAAVLIAPSALLVSLPRCPNRLRVAGILGMSAGLVIGFGEIFFIVDRMNTLFKMYCAVWVLLGLAAVSLLPSFILSRKPFADTFAHRLRNGSIRWGTVSLVLVAAVGTVLNIYVMTTFQRIPGPRPTLNGLAYLKILDPNSEKLYAWVRENIHGTPITVEAQGPPYQNYGRLAMHTGLPTVLGWEHHVSQRGVTRKEIAQRAQDIQTIYSTPDEITAMGLMKKYGARYLLVGNIERERYHDLSELKFKAGRFFRSVFHNGNQTLYLFTPGEGMASTF